LNVSQGGIQGEGGAGPAGKKDLNNSSFLGQPDDVQQQVKVVNPWIHDATHKEYLEQVKVSFPPILRIININYRRILTI
jgi:hypothetical protein